MKVPIKRFGKQYGLPERDPRGGACFDFTVREAVEIPPQGLGVVKLGVAIAIPAGYALLMFARSSLAHRKGVMLANGVGVFDPYFCHESDEYLALLYNFTDQPAYIEAGEHITQGMFIKPEPYSWQEVARMPEDGGGWIPQKRGSKEDA